ncbi:MAG: hypothetical protein RLZ98_859 [Pseudomonadota bacterium]|jgi:RNA-directed DNA polymerase
MPNPDAVHGLPEPLRLAGEPLRTPHDVSRYFGVNHARIVRLLYKAPDNARYTHFEIPKRTGGMRPIHAPTPVLRALQDRLHADLTALYRAHPNAHGFIPGRSVATNAAEHAGKRWVLNLDLEDFFPSINFGRVRGLFLKPPFEMGPAAATICAQIATFRNGLPQGAPTSPVLSNFIAASLDRMLLRLAREHRLVYSRYADDITFSTNQPQFPPAIATRQPIEGGGHKAEIGDTLRHAIERAGFRINEKKVRIQGHSVHQSVTGLCVNTRVNVARKRIRRIRAMLHAWRKFGLEAAAEEHFRKYRPGNGTNRLRSPKAFRNIVYGHLSFLKMVRGADDPLFLKLSSQVLELDPNPSRFLRQMVFGADDYEVFISHASEDKADIARPIFEACTRAGLKAFLDEAHIGFGQSFASKINIALGASRTVLTIISSNSVSKEWPLAEINTALALEVSGQKRVIPVMVGNPDLKALPLIRTKRWIAWDGNADRIVTELKAILTPETPSSVLAVASAQAASPDPESEPAPPVAEQRGWLARLFRSRRA